MELERAAGAVAVERAAQEAGAAAAAMGSSWSATVLAATSWTASYKPVAQVQGGRAVQAEREALEGQAA